MSIAYFTISRALSRFFCVVAGERYSKSRENGIKSRVKTVLELTEMLSCQDGE